ncbi:MAG TPA: fibronectin type III domain-containing protein [Gemmatimonadales bacterium]|jgi:hypothetical protein
MSSLSQGAPLLLAILAVGAGPLAGQAKLQNFPTRQLVGRRPQVGPAPAGLQIAPSGRGALLSWSPTAEQSVYRVYRSSDQASFAELTSAPIPSAPFPDTTAAPGGTYYYRVAAEYADGRVGMTEPVGLTIPASTARAVAVSTVPAPTRFAALPGPAPTNIAASPSPTSVRLSWPALLNVNSYRIERSVAGGQWTTPANVPAPPFTDTGLDPDATVQYRITAQYADGRAGVSDPISTRTTRPVNPANLRATVAVHVTNAQLTPTWNASSTTSGDVTIAWDPVPGAAHYELSGTGLNIPRTLSTTTFGIPDVAPGVARYQVVAYFMNAVGRRFGDAANPARLDVVVGSPPVVGFTAVSRPGSGPGIVDLSWNDGKGATGFKLFRAETETGPFAEVTNLSWAQNWVRDYSSPTRGKSYYYKLVSLFPSGPIAWTSVLRVDVGAEIAIRDLRATVGAGSVTLTWAPLADVWDFSILRGAGNQPRAWILDQYGSPLKLPAGATSYQDSGVLPHTTYRYGVCAKLNNGGGACADVDVAVP